MDEMRAGFLRTRWVARYWSRHWQVEAHRTGHWVVACDTGRWWLSVGGGPDGWQADVMDAGWRSATLSLVPARRLRPTGPRGWVLTLQRDPGGVACAVLLTIAGPHAGTFGR